MTMRAGPTPRVPCPLTVLLGSVGTLRAECAHRGRWGEGEFIERGSTIGQH